MDKPKRAQAGTMFADKDECRAVNRSVYTHSQANTLGQAGFTAAQVAMKAHHVARMEEAPEPGAGLPGLCDIMANKREVIFRHRGQHYSSSCLGVIATRFPSKAKVEAPR